MDLEDWLTLVLSLLYWAFGLGAIIVWLLVAEEIRKW